MPNIKRHIEFDLELRKNPYKGCYVALEGTEGSGKTTQVEILKDYFESKGREVVTTREPRKEGIIGDMVHEVLLGDLKLNPVAFQYLFSADRMLNHADVVEPALKDGKVVISDRSFWSAIVYGVLDKEQEYSKSNVDRLLVAQSVLSFYHQFIVPDFTFYLKIPLEVSVQRIKNERKQAKEIYEDKDKIKKVINGYEELFTEFKDVIIEVDGTKSIDKVTGEIVKKVGDRI
jgi:dTMP kinase